jgi:hypothetical protein
MLIRKRMLAMKEQAPDASKAVQLDPSWYRGNGTLKGQGFLGPLQNSSGQTMSEYSIADSNKLRDPSGDIYPEDNGKESYPTIIPGITAIELNSLLSNGKVLPSLSDKATAFALARRAAGKSLYAQDGEQDYNWLPEFRRLGR